MTSGQLQLSIYSALVGVTTVVTLLYVFIAEPEYLGYTRDGVPHLTPQVAHPQTGEALEMGVLIKHYKGELEDGAKIYY